MKTFAIKSKTEWIPAIRFPRASVRQFRTIYSLCADVVHLVKCNLCWIVIDAQLVICFHCCLTRMDNRGTTWHWDADPERYQIVIMDSITDHFSHKCAGSGKVLTVDMRHVSKDCPNIDKTVVHQRLLKNRTHNSCVILMPMTSENLPQQPHIERFGLYHALLQCGRFYHIPSIQKREHQIRTEENLDPDAQPIDIQLLSYQSPRKKPRLMDTNGSALVHLGDAGSQDHTDAANSSNALTHHTLSRSGTTSSLSSCGTARMSRFNSAVSCTSAASSASSHSNDTVAAHRPSNARRRRRERRGRAQRIRGAAAGRNRNEAFNIHRVRVVE